MRTLHAQRGVTLVEASIVTAIIAITVSTVSPGFAGFIEKQRLEGTATQLATDIQFVRSEAVLRNTALRMGFHADASGGCYVVHTGASDQCVCHTTAATECSGDAQSIKTVQLPTTDGVRLHSNVASILFDPLHGTSTPAGTLKLVATSGRAIHHVVNIMGRVRSCSPQVAAPAVSGYRIC